MYEIVCLIEHFSSGYAVHLYMQLDISSINHKEAAK